MPGVAARHLVRHGRPSGEVADAAAGLAGDQLAGGHVPCVEARLEVGIEPPGRDVAQVESGRAEAADVTHVADQVLDHGGLRLAAAPVGRRTPWRRALG